MIDILSMSPPVAVLARLQSVAKWLAVLVED